MRVLIQRVKKASVEIDAKVSGKINNGLLLLIGIENEDEESDIVWLCSKIVKLRIFNDENGLMNLSLTDVGGELLVISQFTLHASTKKGNRPSYIKAAHPDKALPIYERFIAVLEKELGAPVQKGKFGANMQVELVNDGPVTILIDSKNKA